VEGLTSEFHMLFPIANRWQGGREIAEIQRPITRGPPIAVGFASL